MVRVIVLFVCVVPLSAQTPKAKPYRLPGVDLKQNIIWDTQVDGPNDMRLAFGGQDQSAKEGAVRTRIFKNNQWNDLSTILAKDNVFWATVSQWRKLAESNRAMLAVWRRAYLTATPLTEDQRRSHEIFVQLQHKVIESTHTEFKVIAPTEHQNEIIDRAKKLLPVWQPKVPATITRPMVESLTERQRQLERAIDLMDSEPAGRALPGLVYDAKTNHYVLFGGDHLDYLTNDTWVFDAAQLKWELRLPPTAPPARAKHTLTAKGDGTIVLAGGYTYANNTDYMGGQYLDHQDGDWVYDIKANTWTGKDRGVEPNQRVYRTGPFLPETYVQGDAPDPKAFAQWLNDVPVNTWKKTNPPKRPHMQRDWGTAVLDPTHGMILRWSGGHCAHGGTDVLHYHLATNRWELCYPVEFPLGQLYTNTEYPAGFNFNQRPWVTGHTYQSYGYDEASQKMVFLGQQKHAYIYDPLQGDWVERHPKPPGLDYNSCYYTLTLTPTPHGLICWTQQGKLWRYASAKNHWEELKLEGEKLHGSVVDNSTVTYDSKRDRLLFFRKAYGDKVVYDGQLQEVDWSTKKVRTIVPANAEAARDVPYLCQIRYDATNQLLLVGGTLPPGADSKRRTPVFDCAKDEWGSVLLEGDDPNGPRGRNVSLGLMFDAKSKQFWAVDTYSQVYVLKLDPKKAEYRVLGKDASP